MKFGELRGVEEIGVCPFFHRFKIKKKKNERKLENSEKYEIKESTLRILCFIERLQKEWMLVEI